MKRIIYASNFTLHQKLILILLFVVTFFLGSLMVLIMLLSLFTSFEKTGEYGVMEVIISLLFPISIIILILLFSKKGILIKDNKLYKAQFLFKKNIKKKPLDMTEISDISVLKYNRGTKFSFSMVANPDLGYSDMYNEIYLLNDKHTIKRFLISALDQNLIKETVTLIKDELNLDYNEYNPRF